MSDIAFSTPVILGLPGIGARKVATSFEAIECLHKEWPVWARGPSWRAALMACQDALEGWRDAKVARRRFVLAARKAGLMDRHQPIKPRLPRGAYGKSSEHAAAFLQ